MVFCGKPSKGCAECRKRRIKCDQVRPACSQCQRAEKICSGYRDQLSLQFRDENEKVVRKANVSSTVIRSTAPLKAPISQLSLSREMEVSTPSMPWGPELQLISHNASLQKSRVRLSFDDLGIKFFFTHYVTSASNFTNQSTAASCPLFSALSLDRTFHDALSSVGFAGLSNVTKNADHMDVARKKYARTLGRISSALQDQGSIDKTDLFRAILVLTIFEFVGGNSPTSWGIHIDGATALLSKFDQKSHSHGPALRLLVQFCLLTCVKCIGQGQHTPSAIVDWCAKHQEYLSDTEVYALRLVDLVSQFVDLCATWQKRTEDDSDEDVLEILQALDTELQAWQEHTPAAWHFFVEVVSGVDAQSTFNGTGHIYHDSWTARIYCHYRWCRILVNEFIWSLTSMPFLISPETENLKARSLGIISRLVTEMCCSIPPNIHRDRTLRFQTQKEPPISAVFLFLFPLAVAAGAIGASEDLHSWAIKILAVIGNTMGIRQALSLKSAAEQHRLGWMSGSMKMFFEVL